MNKTFTCILIAILLSTIAFSQDRAKYDELVKEAAQLYESKAFLQSAQTYAQAFIALGNKGVVNDRYNAACSWALANETDSAFVQLFKIARNGNYTNLNHLLSDPDLMMLHKDPKWNEVTDIVRLNKEKAEANLDKPLVAILDTIYQDDQKSRLEIDVVEQKFGWDSPEMIAHIALMNEKDSINLIKIKKILDERGWLGADIIGQQGNQTLFLVIQHADIETQVTYLPMMRDAVSRGKASASSLALLEDRVALRQGARQIYGSQVARDPDTGAYYVMPLDDPDNVDIRREQVGLGKLQDYVSNWGITWEVEEYKRLLPEIEAKHKR